MGAAGLFRNAINSELYVGAEMLLHFHIGRHGIPLPGSRGMCN